MQQKISLQILKVKPFAKKQKWQLCLSEVSLMIFLWWKLHPEVIGVRFGGERGQTPCLKNVRANSVFRTSASCSKKLNDKKYFNTVKNFRATLFFRASASCSNILNVKSIFNTVKIFRANSVFQGKRKLLKNPEPGKKFQYNVFSVYSFGADPCNLGYCSV